MDSSAECVMNMKKHNSFEKSIQYLKRNDNGIKFSDNVIIIGTNRPQPIVVIIYTVFVLSPLLGLWKIPGFQSIWGFVFCILLELILFYQLYRHIRGHNIFVINFLEKYIESSNGVFLYKMFFKKNLLAFDKIGKVRIEEKEEKNADGDIVTCWSQLTVYDNKNEKSILMDFEANSPIAIHVKLILDYH